MNLDHLTTIAAVEQFLEGTQAMAFCITTTKQERYRWIQKALIKHQHLMLIKTDKGVITRYLMKVTEYIHAQTKVNDPRTPF